MLIYLGCPSTFDRKAGHVPTSILKKQPTLKLIIFLTKFLEKLKKKFKFLHVLPLFYNWLKNDMKFWRNQDILGPKRDTGQLP
jgi:hypothetical protein